MNVPPNSMLDGSLILESPTALASDDVVCAALRVRAVGRGAVAKRSRLLRVRPARRLAAVALLSLAVLSGVVDSHAAVLSWTGGGGANANWDNNANWGSVGTPGNGDTLIFPAGAANLLNNNNIAGLTLNQIRFTGPGGGYDIRGNAFTLTNNIEATNSAGTNIIENYITLASTDQVVEVTVFLTLDGQISGGVGLTKTGPGTLLFQGSGDNTYTGTTRVNAGTLQLNVGGYNAYGGALIIGDGSGTGSPTVRLLQPAETPYLQPVTVNLNGLLDLNNFSDSIWALTLQGSTVQTGTGTLVLNSDVTVLGSGVTPTITGNLTFNGGMHIFSIAHGSASSDLDLYANVFDSGGGFLFTNAVPTNTFARLLGNNTFTGPLIVDNITVAAETPYALGTTNSGTTVGSHGTLWLDSIGITGESLTMAAGANFVGQYDCTWTGPITLNGDVTIDNAPDGFTLEIFGQISGSGGFTKTDAGTLQLSGSTSNSYLGNTFIQAGVCQLSKFSGFAIPNGTLTIGDNLGSTATVQDLSFSSRQIGIGVPVRVNNASVLDLNGDRESPGLLTLDGGTIQTGAGVLNMQSDLVSTNSTGANQTSIISGNLNLVGTRNFSINGDIEVDAAIHGGGTIAKSGPNTMYLTASNSYGGTTIVQSGVLWIENPWSLGYAINSTIVSNGASLVITGGFEVNQRSLELHGPGAPGYMALDCQDDVTWVGSIILAAPNCTMGNYSGGQLQIIGAISGAGGITEGYSSGTLALEGTSANTYSGLTTVSNGTTLVLIKPPLIAAVPGDLDIFGTVQLLNNDQNSFRSSIIVESSGVLDFGIRHDQIDKLQGTGSVTFGDNAYVEVGKNNGTSIYNGVMSGTGSSGGYTVGKFGLGTFTMNGNNTFTAGATHVFGGELVINGYEPQIPATVDTNATLGGSGTVGIITANGRISPGNSPGVLSSSNVTLSASANFTVELTGPNPGVGGYDQLDVSGTNNLANASLTVVPGFTSPVSIGQQFVILNNVLSTPITGTFSGLPEGAAITANGFTFTISYVGGAGHSVVLTLTEADPPKLVTQPPNTPVAINQPATFTVGATGASLQYHWFQGTPPDMSTPVGSNSPVLVTAPLTASTTYWVQITNVFGPTVANSAAATAIVIASLTPAPGNYSNTVGAAYPSAFAVSARDYLNNLATNVPVTFTAPSGAVPSSTFPGPSLSTTNTTTSNGVAVAPTCTANGLCGIYNVNANFSTLTTTFSCTNLPTFNAATLAGLTNTDTTAAYNLASATGAQSPGGTFSGTGVSGGNFNPASAGRGPHVITYAVNGVQASFTIAVVETPSLVVTTNADVVNPFDGITSLREAVAYAATLSGTQTITFANNLAGQAIVLTSGAIALNQNVTIDASALAGGIQVNGNHASQVFSVNSGVTAVLDSLTITNGLVTCGFCGGGGILSYGNLTLNDCKVVGNQAVNGLGGALASFGATTLNRTTVAGNLCDRVSGLYIQDGPLTLLDCTISGNSGANGDAIRINAAATSLYTAMSAVNTTISGNTAAGGVGSALTVQSSAGFTAAAFLTNCTVANNTVTGAGQPGAIYVVAGTGTTTLALYNTIVSGNTSGGVPGDITGYASSSSAYNLVGAGGGLVNGVNGNIVGVNNPQLDPLGNYGGETQTMPPLPGSPVVHAGSDAIAAAAGLTTDQRGPGYPRVVGSAVDIGAVEYDAPVITSPSNVTFLAGLSNSFTLTATGWPAPGIAVAGAFPPGVGFTPPATLSGALPDGSGGAYALTVTASNGISPSATQNLTVNVVEHSVFAAHPNFHTNGLGWELNGDTVNGGPTISNNVFTLTDGASGENRSGWFGFPLYVGAFEASFTYQDVGGYGADGVGFVIQNDPRGTTALGLAGGGLGYAGITSSVALLLNIYGGSPGGLSGLMLGTNGVGAYDGTGALSGQSYQSTAPVNLDGGYPIAVALRYTGGILQVSLTDTVTSDNFQTNLPVDVPAFTGTNVAWVGITGSEGGVLSHQTVSNFSYVPLPVLLSTPGSGNSVTLSWPASIYGYHLQSTSNLLGNVWADLPATLTQANGFNQTTVAATNSQFFRLVLPPQ